jgi:soluble lytic murein transglycosylase-like protein
LTSLEKVLLATFSFSALYFLWSQKGIKPVKAHGEKADRVMGYAGDLLRYGVEQGVDPALTAAVIDVESGGNPNAEGSAGEIGLMQILPATGAWINRVTREQLFDPAINIQTGTGYLRYSIDQNGGNVSAGIAGYNYGPGRVDIVSGRLIVPPSVQAYVVKVLSLVDDYRDRLANLLGAFYLNVFDDGKFILNGLSYF